MFSFFHLCAAAVVALVSDRTAAFGAAEQRTSTRRCCWRRSWSLAEPGVKEAICCLTAICKPWPSFPIRGDYPRWDLRQVLCLLVLFFRSTRHQGFPLGFTGMFFVIVHGSYQSIPSRQPFFPSGTVPISPTRRHTQLPALSPHACTISTSKHTTPAVAWPAY